MNVEQITVEFGDCLLCSLLYKSHCVECCHTLFLSRYEMNVPNDVIGAVIGKRGAKINEIR